MPYSKNNYPNSFENLKPRVRSKAIEIVNTLISKENMDESVAIPTAISRARDWAANHDVPVNTPKRSEREPGHDQYVIPHKKGWAVKTEGNQKASRVYDRKSDAIEDARKRAKRNQTGLTIQRSDGTIQDHISYTPRS